MTVPAPAGLRLSDEAERVGHAILTLPEARDEAPRLALRFIDATFLGPDGGRSRGRHYFVTEAVGPPPCREVRLGPEITAHVREAELVGFVEDDGRLLGTLVWEGIRLPHVSGAGARLGSGGAVPRKGAIRAGPVFAARPMAAGPPPAAETAGVPPAADASVEQEQPPPPERPVSGGIRRATAIAGGVGLLVALGVPAAVLAGFAGWRFEPDVVHFAGTAGGAIAPAKQEVTLVTAWYAGPILHLPLVRPPVLTPDGVPPWLALRRTPEEETWIISPAATASTLAAGRYQARLTLAFPLRVAGALSVKLDVKSSDVRPSGSDDAACDNLAGNRFDGDHPSGAGHHDEIFDLAEGEVERGLAACDPDGRREGAARRFGVQRGRLLAHRALLRLAKGDVAAADADMAAAVALWRHGDELGSAYAANLLGAYHDGVFNRAGHAFIPADDRDANRFWQRAMDAGNVVAERNYAAQLLAGKGVAPDPAKAVALLRDALGKGDPHAGGILGVALVTGPPSGAAVDRAEGWRLVIAAQCVDKGAATLLDQRIASGEQPAATRHPCR